MALHLTDLSELIDDQTPRPIATWSSDDGLAIFFNPMRHTRPTFTSPSESDFDAGGFSHWVPLPKIFRCYRTRQALIKLSETTGD